MLAVQVRDLYQELAILLKSLNSAPFGQAQLNDTLAFAETLLVAAKQNPDVIFAQPHLYKKQLPYSLNLIFNSCIMTILVCVRNNVNDSTTQQLVCATLSLFCFEQSKIEQHYIQKSAQELGSINKRLIAALQQTQQEVWSSAYKIVAKIHLKLPGERQGLAMNDKEQILVFIGSYLALQVTPNNIQPKVNFARIVQAMVQWCPVGWLGLFEPLLEYPSLVPVGSAIKYQQNFYIVLSIDAKGYIVRSYTPQKQTQDAGITQIEKHSPIKLLATQSVGSFSCLNRWWDELWQELIQKETKISPHKASFRINSPPALLLAIQKQLGATEPDIERASELIAKDADYSRYLQLTASQNSRQKIQIQEVKHGLMMHGCIRTNSILMQQALLQRLNQHYYPLQENFIQFTKLRSHLATNLAHLNGNILPEEASSLATFSCAGLFTLPALKSCKNWRIYSDNQFDIRQLVNVRGHQLLSAHAIKLAEAWQQDRQQIEVLRHQHSLPSDMQGNMYKQRMASILGLSLMLARQLFFDEQIQGENSQAYFEQACECLSLDSAMLDEIKTQAMGLCHYFWHFPSSQA